MTRVDRRAGGVSPLDRNPVTDATKVQGAHAPRSPKGNARPGLTLLELMLVVFILSMVAFSAVSLTNTLDEQSRFEATRDRWDTIRQAIRGKDIQVYVGHNSATPTPFLWSDVQSVQIDWRVTLENDFEFGNPHAVARDFVDAPQVSGTIELKPITVNALFAKLNQMTGVPANQVVGPQSP